jgi:hypothetical protein
MSARGEGTIQANGTAVTVLFTNRALAEAETAIGRGIIGVAQGFQDGRSGVGDVAQLLRAGMEAARRDERRGGRAVTLQDAYEVLDAAGFTATANVVMTAVAAVLGYSGEVEEVDTEDGYLPGSSPNG